MLLGLLKACFMCRAHLQRLEKVWLQIRNKVSRKSLANHQTNKTVSSVAMHNKENRLYRIQKNHLRNYTMH